MAEGKRPFRPGSRPPRPGVGKPAGTGPATGKARPTAGKPGAGRPFAGRPTAGKPGAGRPFAGKPGASRPFAGKPGASRPFAGRPSAGRPGAAQPAPTAADPRGERLQKVMAHAGVASRRHSEELIMAGRVSIDGEVVKELGTRVKPGQAVEVDGKPLKGPERHIYIVLNKPRGYVTTLFDPQGRSTVAELIRGVPERVYPVGRLDFDTEGVLVFTNDGGLSHALAHPARLVKKTYLARVRGVPSAAKLRQLETGVELDDGPTAPAEAKLVSAGKEDGIAVVSLTIHEGRNRQVKRMLEAVGHEVIGLRRVRLGGIGTEGLAPGQWRELTEEEIKTLYHHAGLKYGDAAATKVVRGRQAVGGMGQAPVRGGRRPAAFKPAGPARPAARGRAVTGDAPRTVRGLPLPKGRPGASVQAAISTLRAMDWEERDEEPGAAPERRSRPRPAAAPARAQGARNPFATAPLKRAEKPAPRGEGDGPRPARPAGFKAGGAPKRATDDIGLPRPARPGGVKSGGKPPREAGEPRQPRAAAGPGVKRPAGGGPRTARPGGFKPAGRPRPFTAGRDKGPAGPKPSRPRRPES